MKHLTFLISLVLMFTFFTSSIAKDTDKDWDKFSQNLVYTIKTHHEGLKQSALQRIIQYSDKLDVQKAAFDIYNIYRWHNNDRVRRLALVALYNTNYSWAMNQILKDSKYETSPTLKRQMDFMVNEYFTSQSDKNLATN
jgi:hypothetical protein